jgi:hypothetical protein
MARMSILIVDLESSRKIEYDKYDIVCTRGHSILAVSIFRHLTHDDALLVILDVFDIFLKFRSQTLFLAISIYSRGGRLHR